MRRAAWAAWASLMAVGTGGTEPVAVVPAAPTPALDGILVIAIEQAVAERLIILHVGKMSDQDRVQIACHAKGLRDRRLLGDA